MSDLNKASLIFQIVSYFKSLRDEDGVNPDDVDTITSLIESTFSVEETPENFKTLSYFPTTLSQIYDAGVENLQAKTTEAALEEVSGDGKFAAFQDLVTKKGFFEGTEVGSFEYLQRQAKLLAKFKERALKETPKDEAEKQAEEKKTLGNTAISAKDYNEAIRFYTEAIQLSPDGPNSHLYYSNRAAAYCFMKEYEMAIQDCESCIELKHDFAKAFSRLGLCNFHAGRYDESVSAYERLVELEPENPAHQDELRKAKKKLEKSLKASPSSSTSAGAGGAPDLSSLMGGGGGLPPQMAGMMNNPAMKSALDRVGGTDGLAAMMKDPQMMAMAQNMMKNPAMMQQAMAMMGGGGGGDMPDMASMAQMLGGGAGAGAPGPSSSSSRGKKPFTGFED